MSAPASGPPHRGGDTRPLRGIPRSRAFWELKAEQMMNRIFDPDEPIDLAPLPEPPSQAADPAEPVAAEQKAARAAAAPPGSASRAAEVPRPRVASPRRAAAAARPAAGAGRAVRRPDERLLLIAALCGVCLVSVAGSLLYLGYWNRLQQNLAQERNLLLVERLRSLGPANPAPISGPEPATPALPAPGTQQSAADGLPPPPPEEPWIEQLSSLPGAAPQASSTPSRVLTVPVSPRLASAAAAPPAAPTPVAAPLPQLVGVVAGGGRAGSAIFLVGGSSMSVGSGELIGSTGWRLRSAEGETALIERGGEVRQISIVSGNGF